MNWLTCLVHAGICPLLTCNCLPALHKIFYSFITNVQVHRTLCHVNLQMATLVHLLCVLALK